jgi:hypothetical protein
MALDFSPDFRIYRENYVGEVSYPTSADVDLMGAGGLTAYSSLGHVGKPVLTGTAAHVSIPGFEAPHILQTVIDGGTHGTADLGVRGAFDNLVLSSDGVVQVGVGAYFDDGFGEVLVYADVFIVQDSIGGHSGFLLLGEYDPSFGPPVTTIELFSAAALSALLAGESFTVDLFVDRAADVADASVAIDGVGTFTAGPQSLGLVGTLPLDRAINYTSVLGELDPPTVNVDFSLLAAYSAVGEVPPAINVDVGAAWGTPASTYAAAGQAGTWNTIGLGTTALVDKEGAMTAVSVTLTNEFDNGTAIGTDSDRQRLVGDHAYGCGAAAKDHDWQLEFSGLDDGSYRVILYAPEGSPATGDMNVRGLAADSISGNASGALLEGSSYVSVTTPVSSGTLSITGNKTKSQSLCPGIAGVQLEGPLGPSAPKVPSLSAAAQALLAMLMIVCGGHARRLLRRHR